MRRAFSHSSEPMLTLSNSLACGPEVGELGRAPSCAAALASAGEVVRGVARKWSDQWSGRVRELRICASSDTFAGDRTDARAALSFHAVRAARILGSLR